MFVSCKKLRDKGLHTFLGMVGYCLKDNCKEYFEFVHHSVSTEDVNDGKMKYDQFKKVGLNNCVSLSPRGGHSIVKLRTTCKQKKSTFSKNFASPKWVKILSICFHE
jgi:hypothetical protein